MKRIMFTQDEGASVAIICPAPGIDINDCIAHVPSGAKYKIVATEEIPSDRTFRDAWGADVSEGWTVKS